MEFKDKNYEKEKIPTSRDKKHMSDSYPEKPETTYPDQKTKEIVESLLSRYAIKGTEDTKAQLVSAIMFAKNNEDRLVKKAIKEIFKDANKWTTGLKNKVRSLAIDPKKQQKNQIADNLKIELTKNEEDSLFNLIKRLTNSKQDKKEKTPVIPIEEETTITVNKAADSISKPRKIKGTTHLASHDSVKDSESLIKYENNESEIKLAPLPPIEEILGQKGPSFKIPETTSRNTEEQPSSSENSNTETPTQEEKEGEKKNTDLKNFVEQKKQEDLNFSRKTISKIIGENARILEDEKISEEEKDKAWEVLNDPVFEVIRIKSIGLSDILDREIKTNPKIYQLINLKSKKNLDDNQKQKIDELIALVAYKNKIFGETKDQIKKIRKEGKNISIENGSELDYLGKKVKIKKILGDSIQITNTEGTLNTWVDRYDLLKDNFGKFTESEKEKNGEGKLIELLTSGEFENIYVHGENKIIDGGHVLVPETDLDAKSASDILADAMEQAQKSGKPWYKEGQNPRTTFIPKGKSNEEGLHLDVGEEGGIILRQIKIDKNGKPETVWQAFIDHHNDNFEHRGSATSIILNLLARHGLIEKNKKYEAMASFVSMVDNFKHVRTKEFKKTNPDFKSEYYLLGWSRSLSAIYEDLPYGVWKKIISDRVEKGISVQEFLSKEELDIETGKIREIKNKEGKVIKIEKETIRDLSINIAIKKSNALAYFPDAEKRMEEIGIKETPELGKIFLDVRQNNDKGTGRINLASEISSMAGYDSMIMIDLKQRTIFISSSKDIGKILDTVSEFIPGVKNIRGNMIITPQDENGVRISMSDDKSFAGLLNALGVMDKTDKKDEELFRPIEKLKINKKTEKIWLEEGADGILHVSKKEKGLNEKDELEQLEEDKNGNEKELASAIEAVNSFAEKRKVIMDHFENIKETSKFTQEEKDKILKELRDLKQTQIDALEVLNKEIERQGGTPVGEKNNIKPLENTEVSPDSAVVEYGGFDDSEILEQKNDKPEIKEFFESKEFTDEITYWRNFDDPTKKHDYLESIIEKAGLNPKTDIMSDLYEILGQYLNGIYTMRMNAERKIAKINQNSNEEERKSNLDFYLKKITPAFKINRESMEEEIRILIEKRVGQKLLSE